MDGLCQLDTFLVLGADEVVDDVTAGSVTSSVAEPLLAIVAEYNGARIVDAAVPDGRRKLRGWTCRRLHATKLKNIFTNI